MWRQLVAHARAHESKSDPGAFVDPKDAEEENRFRGSFSGYERNVFYERQGDRWTEIGYALGLDFDHDGRAVAPLDVDGDGDLDLAILSLQGLKLMRNEAKPKHWLRLALGAKGTERHALGALVTVEAGAVKTIDRVRITAGFHTQVSPELHFGLGDATQAKVTIRWPSGEIQVLEGLAADQRYAVEQGGAARPIALEPWPAEAQPRVGRFDLTVPVFTAEGTSEPLAPADRLHVVNFWAPWCEACKREIPALAGLAQKGIPITGISIETKDFAKVEAFAREHGLTYRNRYASDEAVASFFGPEGKLTLPATFVFDGSGQLRRSFFREVQIAEIQDALRVEAGTARDAWMLAQVQVQEGNPRGAIALLAKAESLGAQDPAALHEIGRIHLMLGQIDQAGRVAAKGLEINGADPELLLLRGETLARSGQLAAAEADVDRALELTPDHRDALINKGLLLKARGDLAEAALRFERALKADPRATIARQELADVRAKLGR